jgi:hypothetical protein
MVPVELLFSFFDEEQKFSELLLQRSSFPYSFCPSFSGAQYSSAPSAKT